MRPPMSRLTAATLRKAHSEASKMRRMHRPSSTWPEWLRLLDNDYRAWRRRVEWGQQAETLTAVRDGS